MADRYRMPVPLLRRFVTLRDLQEFEEWASRHPGEDWWTQGAARAAGVEFTPPPTEAEDAVRWLTWAKETSR
jgi:hypothetical protein